MIANVLTCIGTGTLGVGVGLVINTFRNRKRKRQDAETHNDEADPQSNNTTSTNTSTKSKPASKKTNLRVMYGLQSYFDGIEKFVQTQAKEETHAFNSIKRYIDRILELNELNTAHSTHSTKKRRYWNPAGAISANATKVKLWVKTIDHLFKARLGDNLPEELVESLQYINEYVMAEQYNKLLDN